MNNNQLNSAKRHWILLLLVIFSVYTSGLTGGFVWLDHVEIEQAGYRLLDLQDLAEVWTSSLDSFLDRHATTGPIEGAGGYWRPLVAISNFLSWEIWKDRVWAWKLENILLHLLVCLGLYRLTLSLLSKRSDAPQLAFWGTLLFALHPLNTHSVTWVSGRKDLLCAAFALGSLLLLEACCRSVIPLTRLDRRQDRKPKHGRKWTWRSTGLLVLTGLSCLCALLSKETAFVLPLLLPLFALQPGLSAYRSNHMQRLALLLGCSVTWMVSLMVLAYRWFGPIKLSLNAEHPTPDLWSTVALHAGRTWHFLELVLLPRPALISDAWSASTPPGPLGWLAIAALALALLACAFGTRRRRREAFFGIWFLLWLLPVSGILPLLHLRAERYLYPASWGIVMLAVLLCADARRRIPALQHPLLRLLPFLACVLLAANTIISNYHWANDQRLFHNAVERDPQFAEGWTALGLLALEEEDYVQAVDSFIQARTLLDDPALRSYASPLLIEINLGLAYHRSGQFLPAFEAFMRALELRPDHQLVQHQLSLTLQQLGQPELATGILKQLEATRPNDFTVKSNLAYSRLRSGNFTEAITLLTPLVEAAPMDRQNRVNLASAHLALEQFRAAIPHLGALSVLSPEDHLSKAKLGWALWKVGDDQRGKALLQEALAADPQNPAIRLIAQLTGLPLP